MAEHAILESKRLGAEMSPDDPHTLKLAAYLDPRVLAPAPPQTNNAAAVKVWPMFLNDSEGDCTIASMGHADELWRALGGRTGSALTDADIQATYSAITGYNPTDPSTDRGAVILDTLRYWRKTGFAHIAGRQIGAFASVTVHNHPLVQDAIFYLDGLDCGVNLPVAAQRMGQHWTRPRNLRGANAPGSWGGHCVWAVDYDRYGVIVVTWGELIRVDWSFWDAYFEEAWAVLSPELITSTGRDIQGFDLATLRADLGQIGQVTA